MVDEVIAGERSDRFTVRWDLRSEPGPRDVGAHEAALEDDGGGPGEGHAPLGRGALVAVPNDYAQLRSDDAACASAWRDASAEAIEACLTAGVIAAGGGPAASTLALAP